MSEVQPGRPAIISEYKSRRGKVETLQEHKLPPVQLTWHQSEDKPEIWTVGPTAAKLTNRLNLGKFTPRFALFMDGVQVEITWLQRSGRIPNEFASG